MMISNEEVARRADEARATEQRFADGLLAGLRSALDGDRAMNVAVYASLLDEALSAGGPLPSAWARR